MVGRGDHRLMSEGRDVMRPAHGGARGPQLMCEGRDVRPGRGGAVRCEGTAGSCGHGREAGAGRCEGTTGRAA